MAVVNPSGSKGYTKPGSKEREAELKGQALKAPRQPAKKDDDGDDKIQKIAAAFRAIKDQGDAAWAEFAGDDGVPNVGVTKDAVGFKVSADERDAALALLEND